MNKPLVKARTIYKVEYEYRKFLGVFTHRQEVRAEKIGSVLFIDVSEPFVQIILNGRVIIN